jgi:hypothetical protein
MQKLNFSEPGIYRFLNQMSPANALVGHPFMTAQHDDTLFFGTKTEIPPNMPSIDCDIFDGLNHLVLDLDHTLISSFEFGESPVPRRPGECSVSPILTEEYKDELGMPQMYHATISNVVVLIKLRPFVRSFIKSAASLGLTLHVYTKGRRAYMNEVLRLIDPEGLIRGRRISRDDEPEAHKESQKDIVLIQPPTGSSNLYIVLDDSPAVWSACLEKVQLITARRYTFSDKFVMFLRSMERARSTSLSYPPDADDYLANLADSVIKSLLDMAPAGKNPPTIESQQATLLEEYREEEETFTPINVWTKRSQSASIDCAVINVTRNRFV